MIFQEKGVLSKSIRYLFTPSSFAEQVLFYPTRIGHFFCNRNYHFSNQHEIARLPSHQLHYMLFLLKNGSMELSLNGKKYTAAAGDAVFFDCKNPHEYRSLCDDLEFFWLVFDGITCPVYMQQILTIHNHNHVFPCANSDELEHLLLHLINYHEQTEHPSEISISETIYSMLCCIMLSQKSANNSINMLVEDAMHYMDIHFHEVLSVADIASQVGLSASYLTRCFRQQTGYSPHEYLTLRRIGYAKDCLLSSGQSIQDIAANAGYKSTENFIRSFKKAVGVSPSSYRKYMV